MKYAPPIPTPFTYDDLKVVAQDRGLVYWPVRGIYERLFVGRRDGCVLAQRTNGHVHPIRPNTSGQYHCLRVQPTDWIPVEVLASFIP
jgi:hypothetical protein